MSRSFTIERIENVHGKKIKVDGGRYLSSSPANAAKKVVSRICRTINVHGQCTFIITMRETTQGASTNGKLYCYKVKRILDPVVIERDGVEIEYAYRTEAHAY